MARVHCGAGRRGADPRSDCPPLNYTFYEQGQTTFYFFYNNI